MGDALPRPGPLPALLSLWADAARDVLGIPDFAAVPVEQLGAMSEPVVHQRREAQAQAEAAAARFASVRSWLLAGSGPSPLVGTEAEAWGPLRKLPPPERPSKVRAVESGLLAQAEAAARNALAATLFGELLAAIDPQQSGAKEQGDMSPQRNFGNSCTASPAMPATTTTKQNTGPPSLRPCPPAEPIFLGSDDPEPGVSHESFLDSSQKESEEAEETDDSMDLWSDAMLFGSGYISEQMKSKAQHHRATDAVPCVTHFRAIDLQLLNSITARVSAALFGPPPPPKEKKAAAPRPVALRRSVSAPRMVTGAGRAAEPQLPHIPEPPVLEKSQPGVREECRQRLYSPAAGRSGSAPLSPQCVLPPLDQNGHRTLSKAAEMGLVERLYVKPKPQQVAAPVSPAKPRKPNPEADKAFFDKMVYQPMKHSHQLMEDLHRKYIPEEQWRKLTPLEEEEAVHRLYQATVQR